MAASMVTARRGRQALTAGRPARGLASGPTPPAQPAPGRTADAIDVHVGDRLRVARKALGLTQEALAARLGITFQQLQKYEKGINRISAGRLHHAAGVLGVPISFFFPDSQSVPPEAAGHARALAESIAPSTIDGIELNRAFSQIADAGVRKRVVDLVRSIAQSSGDGAER